MYGTPLSRTYGSLAIAVGCVIVVMIMPTSDGWFVGISWRVPEPPDNWALPFRWIAVIISAYGLGTTLRTLMRRDYRDFRLCLPGAILLAFIFLTALPAIVGQLLFLFQQLN